MSQPMSPLLFAQVAQVDDISRPVETAIRQAGSYGGDVFLTALILLGIFLIAGVYVWFVVIPNSRSSRENAQKLAEATIGISQITSKSYEKTTELAEKMRLLEGDVSRALSCAEPIVKALEKVSKANGGIDISSELGEIRGTIKRSV